jgi:hypothetical protein
MTVAKELRTLKVRVRGFCQLLGFGAVFAGGIASLMWLRETGDESPFQQLAFHAMFVPGGLAIAGLVQLVSGVRFSELSQRWDSLQGWQRGVFGTLLVLLCITAMLGALVLYGMYFFNA